jgi:hypothetical protein
MMGKMSLGLAIRWPMRRKAQEVDPETVLAERLNRFVASTAQIAYEQPTRERSDRRNRVHVALGREESQT